MSDGNPNESSEPTPARDWFGWLLLGAALLLVIGIRLRTLDVPLERDEGEYAYIASLMLRGVPPYAEAYTMKFPGTPAMYAAAFAIFGESTRGVHLALLSVNVGAILILYWLARRWHDGTTSALAAAIYGLWSLMPGLQGTSAHAEHFAVLFGLAGYAALVPAVPCSTGSSVWRLWRVFFSGLLFGTAVLMKQQAAFFVAPALIYLLVGIWREPGTERRPARLFGGALALACGALLPFVALVAALAHLGVFDTFWFWTVTYASTYGTGNPDRVGAALRNAFDTVGGASYLLDGLFLFGLASLVCDKETCRGRLLAWTLFVGGVVAVVPSLRFYEHYFVFLLPAASLIAALGLIALARLIARWWDWRSAFAWQAALILLILGVISWENRMPWFRSGMVALSRITYGLNPFPESLEVARYLQQQALPGDRLLVFGSEPQLYFYTHMPAATKYIYTYPLVEQQPYAQQMQREMMDEIERTRPEYCISFKVLYSWVPAPGAPNEIFEWWNRYLAEHYELIGMVEMFNTTATSFAWGHEALSHQPRTRNWLGVYRRRNLKPVEPRN